MGITFKVDHERREVIATAEGPITLEDIREHIEHERREAGLGYCELVDARNATPAVTPEDVRKAVGILRALAHEHPLGPTAVVVVTDYAFGMMRMFEMLVEDAAAVRPFRSLDDAQAWLDSRIR